MLTNIVVLYIAITMGAPKWCIWFIGITIGLKCVMLLHELWQK